MRGSSHQPLHRQLGLTLAGSEGQKGGWAPTQRTSVSMRNLLLLLQVIDVFRAARKISSAFHFRHKSFIFHSCWCETCRVIQQQCWMKECDTIGGVPGRHVEKTDTFDIFPSSVREPKIECLDLYTYVNIYICMYTEIYICTSVSGSSWNFQSDKSPPPKKNRTVRFKIGHLATLGWGQIILRTLLHIFRGSRLPQPLGSTPLLKRTPTLGRARTRLQIDRAIRTLDDLRYVRTGPEAAALKPITHCWGSSARHVRLN